MQQVSGVAVPCPLCGAVVPARRGCADCHLSAADIRRHYAKAGAQRRGAKVSIRVMGLIVYGGVVAWSLAFMRQAFPFVLPGAAVGAYLQTVRGRPILGA